LSIAVVEHAIAFQLRAELNESNMSLQAVFHFYWQ